MSEFLVAETDVLIATLVFLLERGVSPYQLSIPRGKGIDTDSAKRRILTAFNSVDRQPKFSNEGSDIIGISESEWWHIECKGVGSGKQQTQRNNFDRALASVVSYYGADTAVLPNEYKNAKNFLGLSLPSSTIYLKELKRRVRRPLREILNLWILLYEHESGSIRAISPGSEY